MNWQSNKGFTAEELTKFGKNVWDEKLYIIRYKGFSNVTIESDFNNWIKEVDDLKIEKEKA
jgi:hypothetical protein